MCACAYQGNTESLTPGGDATVHKKCGSTCCWESDGQTTKSDGRTAKEQEWGQGTKKRGDKRGQREKGMEALLRLYCNQCTGSKGRRTVALPFPIDQHHEGFIVVWFLGSLHLARHVSCVVFHIESGA